MTQIHMDFFPLLFDFWHCRNENKRNDWFMMSIEHECMLSTKIFCLFNSSTSSGTDWNWLCTCDFTVGRTQTKHVRFSVIWWICELFDCEHCVCVCVISSWTRARVGDVRLTESPNKKVQMESKNLVNQSHTIVKPIDYYYETFHDFVMCCFFFFFFLHHFTPWTTWGFFVHHDQIDCWQRNSNLRRRSMK